MLARAVAVLVVTLAMIDAAALAAARRWRLDERPVDIQSRDSLRAMAATLERRDGPAQVAFLGSSFVFGRHLESAHGGSWPEYALAGRYAQVARRSGQDVHAVNLGVNGLLFHELDCVAAEALSRRPALLFVNVSPRPFARDFATADDDGEARADRGLCLDTRRPLDRLAAPLRDAAFDHLPLLRYRDLAQFSALSAPPRLAAVAALRRRFGLASPGPGDAARVVPAAPAGPAPDVWDDTSPEEAAVLHEMAWRLRAAHRYDSIEVGPRHPQASHLRSLVERLARAAPTRVVLFYVEEDMGRLTEQADIPHFERQRDEFIAMVEGLSRPRSVPFRVVRRDEIGSHYTDHVHLDGEGYRRLAELLFHTQGAVAR
jgi:hypothetical protein